MQISVLIMCSVRWYNASAQYALHLALSLKKSGLNVALFGIPGSPLIIKAKEEGLEVIENIGLMNSGFLSYIINLIKFRRFINKNRFNIINPHISRDHVFAFISLIGKKKYFIRTRTDSKVPKSNFLNKVFYNISSGLYIISSNYMRPYITRLGIPNDRTIVIPLEMNYKSFASFNSKRNLKQELNISKYKKVVSFIGRLDRIKGVEFFLKSYAYLHNKEKFHFLISGEEINLTIYQLKRIAKEIKITNISFLGRMDEVREILSITDIGVIPSIGSESICRIGLEMLAFGIPIIGSNINSIPELINDFGGIIVEPGSPEQIAEAIEYYAVSDNYNKSKENILSKIAERPPDKFAMEYIDVFSKIINQ